MSRKEFLKEFTRELITNSKKEEKFFVSHHPVKETFTGLEGFQPVNIIKQTMPVRNVQPKIMQQPRYQVRTQTIQPAQSMQPQFQGFQINLNQMSPRSSIVNQIAPEPQPLPAGFELGKLTPLIQDNRVTSIECPGPGKYVLVNTAGKINVTQIMLSEEEIKRTIERFAQETKIPIIGGVFKAAIGNLVITAVISEFVGSRFIINKYTPYSILQQK